MFRIEEGIAPAHVATVAAAQGHMILAMENLPTLLLLAVLIGIFMALRRHSQSSSSGLWIWAWSLIFLHFLAQSFESGSRLAEAADVACLSTAAAVFLVSVLRMANTPRRQALLIAVVGAPFAVYSVAMVYGVAYRPLYILCLLISCFGTLAVCTALDRTIVRDSLALMAVGATAGGWAVLRAGRFDYAFGFVALLTVGFGLPGILFWRRHRRSSPGVWTVTLGFLGWGAVFPLATWFAASMPQVRINPDLWNVPKFFVAFGMILTAVEDATARELAIKRQLQRFAELISKMLNGGSHDEVCAQVADAIVETSPFGRCNIVLRSPYGLRVAGSRGLSETALADLRREAPRWTVEDLGRLIAMGRRFGPISYLLTAEQLAAFRPVLSDVNYPPGSPWHRGDKIMVPLRSRRGGYIGCIVLDEPRDPAQVTAEELSRIELLAGDLATALENDELQQQLVSSEKMAAMGRLVAGVAHELNNPLTAVLGYADLLSQDMTGVPQQQLNKLVREAMRMKRIIANLLVFARQEKSREKETDLSSVLREVLTLREYHLDGLGIAVETSLDPELPRVAIDEDHLRQILLNLINNAIDAVAEVQERKIRLIGSRQGERVMFRVEDTGPGFSDLQCAVDPFWTTKPVGKGTGLGLSICYGIVKDLGGDVRLQNLDPCGAAVTIDIPAANAYYAAPA